MKAGRSAGKPRGFTLIEVMVAFVILALSLAAILPALSGSLGGARAASDRLIAAAYAQSLLDGIGAGGRVAEGEFRSALERPGLSSLITVRPLDEGSGKPDVPRLYEVSARVAWRAGGGERAVTLVTTRYARAAR
jgi:general secretion pathway protein I